MKNNLFMRCHRFKTHCSRSHVICLLIVTQLVTSVHATIWNRFFKMDAQRLNQTYTQVEARSVIGCGAMCGQDGLCQSASYEQSTRACHLSVLPLEQIDANSELEAGWVTVGNADTHGWMLLFQAIADIGPDPYVAWTLGTVADVTTDDVNCMGSDVSLCTKHYRSNLVNFWHAFGNFEVKISLMKDQSEAAYITFDGTGSNRDDWFSAGRVINSTWTVLNQSIEYFTMEGVPAPERRFCIVHYWNGCPNDPSVLVVKNPGGICAYDAQPSYPRLLYSVSNTWANFYNPAEYDFADSMRISVRLL